MNIFLIGYRSCGKSTVAKPLAQRLGWPAVDTDEQIEQTAGKSIAQIFSDDGEAAFRDLDSHLVADAARRDQHVIALGGGAMMREENRRALEGRGVVVWLVASAETLFARMSADTTTSARRPNLTQTGGLAEVQRLLKEREPVYRAAADLELHTENRPPNQLADEIFAWLKQGNLVIES